MSISYLKLYIQKRKGQTLIELILVMGLAAIILPALLTGFVASRNGKPQQEQRLQAISVLKETEAALRNIRNTNWNLISQAATNSAYHVETLGSQWVISSGPLTNPAGITQELVISDVQRDNNGSIVSTGGIIDQLTKKIEITISWSQPEETSVNSTLYLVNIKNETKTHTTNTDFAPGIQTSTIVVNTQGGEVKLEQSVGQADWCMPQDSVVENLTLPKKGNAIYAPAVGSAHLATGDGTAGESFINVGINYPTPPASPSATVIATHLGNYQTNAIYSDGTYAYLAINGTSQQVRILNIANQPYTEVGTISLPSNTNANGVYVSGNFAYVTSGDKLYKINVTNKTGTHSPSASVTMRKFLPNENASVKQVFVVNDRIFVTAGGSLFGLQLYRTSDLRLIGLGRPGFRSTPTGLFVNSTGTRAYVTFSGANGGTLQRGFYIINTYEPESVWIPILAFYYHFQVGIYDTGSMDPRAMSIAPDNSNRALIGGIGGQYEYQVINIANESNPVFCGGLDIPSGVTGVAGALDQFSNVYSFLLTGGTSDQFKMVKGGAGGGGGGYASSGTYESDTIQASDSAVFNRFTASISQPVQTIIQMQVGVTSADLSGTCNGAQYTYVGPNGDTSAYFTPTGNLISGVVPLGTIAPFYQNGGKCFRYKTYYTNTGSASPILYDFTVNYSPYE